MDNKMGCFGSILYYAPKSNRCTRCPLIEPCGVKMEADKTAFDTWYTSLRDRAKVTRSVKSKGAIGIKPIAAPTCDPTRAAVAVTTAPLVATGAKLQKKPQEFVNNWCKKGIKFDAYKDGSNPFATCGNKFAVIAMDLLLEKNTIGKEELIDVFMAKTTMGPGAASSHANITFDAFEYLGIITIGGGERLAATATLR